MTYTVLIRPCCDLERVHVEGTADGYGVSGDVRGWVTLETEGRSFHLHPSPSSSRFDSGDDDLSDVNDEELHLDFPDDAAALAWVDWFDGLHLDPWRCDFLWRGEDGNGEEIYVR